MTILDGRYVHPARQFTFDALHNLLQHAVISGDINVNREEDLYIYTYSKQCVYEKHWDEITKISRGLILDLKNKCVVATPFPKFFNYMECAEDTIPDLPFEVFEKVDGSLIIIFYHNKKWKCATKGSFVSDQAQWAQKKLDEIDQSNLIPGWTYLCEAVYPENRIVVSYEKEELVLLGAYDQTGFECAYSGLKLIEKSVGWRVATRTEFESIIELVAYTKVLPSSEEGFVVRFQGGFRLKFKGDEYCRLHRCISNVTPLVIWEMMRDQGDMEKFRQDLPEEFWGDFDDILGFLIIQRTKLLNKIFILHQDTKELSDKELGLKFKEDSVDIQSFVWVMRKNEDFEYGRIEVPEATRRKFYDYFRPTGNKLSGYIPSKRYTKFLEELT